MDQEILAQAAPRMVPALDPGFRPSVLVNREFLRQVRASGEPVPVQLALEQPDGSVFHFHTEVFGNSQPMAAHNAGFIERLVKFLLWSRGGFRLFVAGPKPLAVHLQRHFLETAAGRFDSELIGERVYGRPIEVVHAAAADIPAPRARARELGRHLDGCRIGFDLGGSDRKVAAVEDGTVVFSEETVWNPYPQSDPQYHFDGIMDSLKRAAARLPRVDAIGGSAAGVYVENRVRVASLFRGVPRDVFDRRVKDLFLEIQRAWNGVPLEVVNDGEVTALAGSMALGRNAVLGLALGTSLAAGYVTRDGGITSWLNELAFAPVDANTQSPRDEWSGDYGVGVQYLSQQAVGRLAAAAGIAVDPRLSLPETLRHVQDLMKRDDPRARGIYQTLGTYLGYAVALYAGFYDFDHVLVLGRVTSGAGGGILAGTAREILMREFPELAGRIAFHLPDEKDKRLGQAVAAASLPELRSQHS